MIPKITLLFILLPVLGIAQSNVQLFGESDQHDYFTHLLPDSEGNFYALGSFDGHISLHYFNEQMEQQWVQTYPQTNEGYLESGNRLLLHDGSLFIVGEAITDEFFDDDFGLLIKTNLDGTLLWRRDYDNTSGIFDIIPFLDGMLLSSYYEPSSLGRITYINNNGEVQWSRLIDIRVYDYPQRIFPVGNDRALIVGRTGMNGAFSRRIFIRLVNEAGTTIWQQILPSEFENAYSSSLNVEAFRPNPMAAIMDEEGNLWVAHTNKVFIQQYKDLQILKFAPANGEILENYNYPITALDEAPHDLYLTENGDLIVSGNQTVSVSDTVITQHGLLARYTPGGLMKWKQTYRFNSNDERLLSVVEKADGGLLAAGMGQNEGAEDGLLRSVPADGNILPTKITGSVFIDIDGDCTLSTADLPAPNWMISADQGQAVQIINSDQAGLFSLYAEYGTTSLQLHQPPALANWSICNSNINATTSLQNPEATVTFLVQPEEAPCEPLSVYISQPDVVRCQTSRFWLTVTNQSPTASLPQQLRVHIDDDYELEIASAPVSENGPWITFDLAPIPPFQSTRHYVDLSLSCDPAIGATHPVTAQLIDSSCTADWSGPIFSITKNCNEQSIDFIIKNEGTTSAETIITTYDILADDLLIASDQEATFSNGADTYPVTLPADGRTWRLQVRQAEGYPFEQIISEAVEGCGKKRNGLYSIHQYNAHHLEDRGAAHDEVNPSSTTAEINKIEIEHEGIGFYNITTSLAPIVFTVRATNPSEVTVQDILLNLEFEPTLDLSTLEILGGNAPVQLTATPLGMRFLMQNANIPPGGVALIKGRIQPYSNTPPDAGQESILYITGEVFFDGKYKTPLKRDFNNYSILYPAIIDTFYEYQQGILKYGSPKNWDFANIIDVADDGYLFMGAVTLSFGDRSAYKGLIVKTRPGGEAVWQEAIVPEVDGQLNLAGIAALSDGGCLIAGNSRLPGVPLYYLSDNYAFYGRMNAYGELVSYNQFRPQGEENEVSIAGLLGTPDGGGIVFGYSRNSNNMGTDPIYIKLNNLGVEEWRNTDIVVGSAFIPVAGTILPDGSAVFTGTNESTEINVDTYIQQVKPDGNIGFTGAYQSENGIHVEDIALSSDNSGVVVVGYSQWGETVEDYVTTPTLIKFSLTGDFLWENNPIVDIAGPVAFVSSVIPDTDNGFLIGGDVSAEPQPNIDMMLAKVDENGDLVWVNNYGNRNRETIVDLAWQQDGTIAAWGYNQPRPLSYDLQALYLNIDPAGQILVNTQNVELPPQAEVLLFPNPGNTSVQLALSPLPHRAISYQLFDINGRQKAQGTTSPEGLTAIAVDQFPAGIYFLVFDHPDYPTKRLMVVR